MVNVGLKSAIIAALLAGSSALAEPETVTTPPPVADAQGLADLAAQVALCWRAPSVPDGVAIRIVLAIDLDGDGRFIPSPRLVEPTGATAPGVAAAYDNARRAILRCGGGGFDLDPAAYESWKTLELVFEADRVTARPLAATLRAA